MTVSSASMIAILLFALSFGCNRKEEKQAAPAVRAQQPPVQRSEPIEIYTLWSGPGEDEAYQAFMDVFNREFPTILLNDLSKIPGHGDKAYGELMQRIPQKNPPDSFQVYPALLAQFMVAKEKQIEPLDALYKLKYWGHTLPEIITDTVSHDGHIYAVPIGMHRRNTMFCNPELVQSPPKTLAELFSRAEALKAEGTDAVVVTIKDADWPLMLMFNAVMTGSAGIPFMKDFYEGRLSFRDSSSTQTLEKVISDYQKLLGYANTDGTALNWRDGARRVMEKKAAIYIHGDWVTGYYKSLGWSPSVAPAPGTDGLFALSLDAFTLCTDAPHPENARRFLSFVGSQEGQTAFNRLKGSLPARNDVSVKGWGPIAEATYADFRSATFVFNVDKYLFIGLPEQLRAFYDKSITAKALHSWIILHYKTELVTYDSLRLRSHL